MDGPLDTSTQEVRGARRPFGAWLLSGLASIGAVSLIALSWPRASESIEPPSWAVPDRGASVRSGTRILRVACLGNGRGQLYAELREGLRTENLDPLERDGSLVLEVERVESLLSLEARFASGELDFFVGSPFVAKRLMMGEGRGEAILHRPGKPSVLCVPGWAEHTAIGDLRGLRVALGEIWSPATCLEAVGAFSGAAVELQRLGDPRDPVREGRVGWVLANDPETAYFWLMRGRVDAIALDERDFERFALAAQDSIRVLHRTAQDLPGEVVVARGDLEYAQQSSIRWALDKSRPEGDPRAFREATPATTRALDKAWPRWLRAVEELR